MEDWFAWLREGRIVLPRFQRFEAWSNPQVQAVLENLLRKPSLPIGAVLVLEIGTPPPFIARPISGTDKPSVTPSYHLLDGQQRITAIWRSLSGDYEDYDFNVEIDNMNEPSVSYVRRYEKKGTRFPLWCDKPTELYDNHLVPCSILAPGDEHSLKADEWVAAAAGNDPKQLIKISKIVTELRSRIANFSLPFLSLPQTTSKDAALDVFIKMNTLNTALTAFDIVTAQVEASMGESLHEKVDDLVALIPQLASYGNPGEIAMQVAAVLDGSAPNRASFLKSDFGQVLINNWQAVETGLQRAISFLEEEKIFDATILPSDPILIVQGAFWAKAPVGSDAEGKARRIARRALWRGAFTERYQKTSATRSELDARQLSNYLNSDDLPDILNDEMTPLPTVEELKSGGWPKTKDRLGRAIMASSLRKGGFDFADEAAPSRENLAKREYHHLYPKALLEARYPRRVIFSALNCALISWRTNRNIGAKTPSKYIAERADDLGISAEQVQKRLRSHVIPVKTLKSDDFAAFIDKRAKSVHKYMAKLCAGELQP